MGAPHDYSKAVYAETGYWGTFPLDLPIKVGDVVELEDDGKMKRLDSVLDWPGWPAALPIEHDPVNSNTGWSHSATKSVMASAEGGATTAGGIGATAKVKISFSAVGGFVLEFVSGEYRKFRSVISAQNAVLGLYKNGQWQASHALITEILCVAPATVLMSSARNTSVILSAKATLPSGVTAINLADPQLGFSVTTGNEDVLHTLSREAFPLYHCVRIKKKWWGGKFAELQGVVEQDMDEVFLTSPFDDNV
jgi:hypothetical protein